MKDCLIPGVFVRNFFALTLLSFTTLIISCTERHESNEPPALIVDSGDIGLNVSHLRNFSTKGITNCEYFRDANQEYIACIDGPAINIFNVNLQKYIDTIKIDYPYQILRSFDIINASNFAIYADSSLILVTNGEFVVLSDDLQDDNLQVRQVGEIAFFPNQSKLVFEVIDYGTDKGDYLFDYRFLMEVSTSGELRRLDLKYPKIYGEGELGEPRLYMTSTGDSLLLSLSYSDDVYIYDIVNQQIHSESLGIRLISTDLLPQETGDRAQRIIARDERDTYYESYTKVFWDKGSESWYRLFIPRLTRQTTEGYYTSTLDRRHALIRKSKHSDSTLYYSLPAGRYFMRNFWWNNGDTLIYLKKNLHENHIDDYYMDRVYTYSY